MRLDRMNEIFRIPPLPEPLQGLGRVRVGVLFEVEVVQEPGDIPEVFVPAKFFRIPLHRGRDHTSVVALVLVFHVLF